MAGDLNPFQRAFSAPHVALYLIVRVRISVLTPSEGRGFTRKSNKNSSYRVWRAKKALDQKNVAGAGVCLRKRADGS